MKEKNDFHPMMRRLMGFPLFDDEDLGLKPFSMTDGLSVSEDKEHIYVEAMVPGLKTEDIEVHFEKGVLWIKGEKKEEHEDKKRHFYRKAHQSFSYSCKLPSEVDQKDEPEARIKDGVVTVRFKKLVHDQPKKIHVKGV
jgi:HSP20 family protein